MKICLVFGTDISLINKRVDLIKLKYSDYEVSNLSSVTSQKELQLELASESLFSAKRLLVLADPKEELVLDLLPDKETTVLLIIVNDTLGKKSTLLEPSKKHQIEVVSFLKGEEVSVFPFLDALFEKKSSTFKDLEKLETLFGGQYLLTMIGYGLRRMILPQKSDFMQQKINRQKRSFDLAKIRSVYLALLETDFKIKSGLLEEKLGLSLLVQKIIT